MKIGFISLGCSKNLVDSEKMMAMLRSGNHKLVSNVEEAEAIIINTCGFIQSAKEEAINTIFEMAQYKQYKCKKLIVVGCLAQRYKETLVNEIPEIDAVISIREYPDLAEILGKVLGGEPMETYGKSERLISQKPWTAYLKIAEGCSNNCTYCAIPLIRGENVSTPMEELIEEAKVLAKNGVKELVLIAQDTTKYGLDLYEELKLADLLEELHKIESLHWIRVLYMYPDEIEDALLEKMAKLEKVIPYFDIPMQHASNKMLELMNRRGRKEDVLTLVDKIKKTFEQPTLRTTFIVGFPQEEQADFDEMMQFVRDVKWHRMGAFTYSPEEDTIAYDMEQTVPEEVKQERLDALMKLQNEISLANQQAYVGKTIEVLVESKDALKNMYIGRSKACAPDEVDGMILFTSNQDLTLGSFVNVTITQALPYDLIGTLA